MAARSRKTPWYSEAAGFFGPGYLSEYGHLSPERTRSEVDFIEKTLRLDPGARILDCPCGHGRHAIELARRGYAVTGQDLNAFFLDEAKKAAREADAKVTWRKGDMRRPPKGPFDAAFNLYTSFGYFADEADDQLTLDATARVLRSGAVFVLDIQNRDRMVRMWQQAWRDWTRATDGSVVTTERTFDMVRGRVDERRVRMWRDREHEEVSTSLRAYAASELAVMLARAGLRLRHAFGGYDGVPLTPAAQRCILVAERV